MIIRVHGPLQAWGASLRTMIVPELVEYYRAECCGSLATGATREDAVAEMRWTLKDPGLVPVLTFPAGVEP